MRKVLGKICGWFSLFCASWLLAFNATAGLHFDLNVNVGAPGYFGPIPMVSGMVPQLWNVQPVIAVGPVVVAAEPIYLRVPNFQRKSWRKYCGRYGACERPVFFVKNSWYEQEYGPRYHPRHDEHYYKHMEKEWKHHKKMEKHFKKHFKKHHHHHDDD